MKWFLKDKLIKELKQYFLDNTTVDYHNGGAIEFKYRFDVGFREILEKYYDAGRKD